MSLLATRPSVRPPRPLRAAPPAALDDLELSYLLLLGAVAATGWLAFTLAEVGLDRPVPVLILGVIGLGVAAVIVFGRPRPYPGLADLLGLALPLVLGGLWFFPPDEWILGDLDPGSYVNTGAAIARTGRIVFPDPTLAALPPTIRAALFRYPASRLPGMYLTTARYRGLLPVGFVNSPDAITPHGFHLFPVDLAFGYALAGIRGELLLPPLFALLGLAGFYLLLRRLFGAPVGAVAAVLLALSPAEVWFARYPDAEILAQALLFGGLLAFVALLDAPNRWLGLLAGLCLGSVHLDKIELLALPLLIAAYFGYAALTDRFPAAGGWFLGAYGAVLLEAILHATYVATWYTATTFQKTFTPRLLALAGLAAGVALLAAILLVAWPGLRQRVGRLLVARWWETPAAVFPPVGIALAAFYAYYLRPLASPTVGPGPIPIGQAVALTDLQSFVHLGWYVTPLGLLLGTVGWMLLVARERNPRAMLLLLLLGADTGLFLDHMDITPIHYWAARRWVALVIPGFALTAAYLLVYLLPRARRRWIDAALPAACGVVLVAGLLGADQPLAGYVEYRGAIDQIGALATAIPADGVVFFADGDAGERLSTPMQYLFDRTSFLIYPDAAMDAAAGREARSLIAQGHPVFWISTPDLPGPQEIGMAGTMVWRQHLALPEKLATVAQPPGADGLFQQRLEVWQLH